jgi:hypothetical protein
MNEELFVSAWKKGIKKVRAEFFNIKASSLDMAQKKWQPEPNYPFIKNEMGSYSHGKPECGQELLIQAQSPNFVQAIFILDEEARNIISQLWLHYTGW